MTIRSIKVLTIAFAVLLVLAGCSTPNYALKPVPLPSQSSYLVGNVEVIDAIGGAAKVSLAAEVDDLFKSRYILVSFVITNSSSLSLECRYDCFDVRCSSSNTERLLLPLEPEALLSEFEKERRASAAGRGWGTFFDALIAAHHSPGENVDTSKVSDSIKSGNSANRAESEQESQMLRVLDRELVRRSAVLPGKSTEGIVLFPFSKWESYKVRMRIGEAIYEFAFRLRTY